nr:ribonuclease H-like domain-containing protein [Tanacetum cinerariifolium]
YELIRGRPPLIDFMKPFGCPVTILNTKDYLGKFDEKTDEGFFVGYYVVSKAMGVFNKRTRIVEKTLNIRFLDNTHNVKGNGPDWLFDIESLTISMNYVPVVAGFQTNVARIKAIRLFLAYTSFKDFVVYQMGVKSAFFYGKIEEEVYVCQPPGSEDPDFLNKSYKVEKALYGLHQAPRDFKFNKRVMESSSAKTNIDSPFDLEAYSDSDYARASLDRKSTTGAKVKKVNDQKQIQALVDKQKVIITEESIRRDLKFNDAEGTACLPNDTIFVELARMSAKTTSWNEFSSTMASAIICLANNQKFNFSTYILDNMVKHLEGGQGFSWNVTPLFETMMVIAQEEVGRGSGLRILKKVGSSKQVESFKEKDNLGTQDDASKQGRSIEDIDQDAEIALVDEAQGRMHDAYMLG